MEYLENYTFDELELGQTAQFSRSLTEQDLILFATVSGDVNPVHLDAEFAANSMFKQRIAHGAWSGSLISAALANILPGPGTIYLGQTLKFSRPVTLGDTVTIQLEVKEKGAKNRVTIACVGKNQHGKEVISGEAQVLAPNDKIKVEKPVLPEVSIK